MVRRIALLVIAHLVIACDLNFDMVLVLAITLHYVACAYILSTISKL
jgi:hypothetical protein